jgi:UDP-N-acetyl-D-galactosamine dehydrogenase
VADIISELEEFGANVDVYDPLIDSKQMNNRYKIITDPLKSNKKYDAIIVTVSHKQFKAYTSNDYSRLSSDDKIIIDIKNIVENPTWKL